MTTLLPLIHDIFFLVRALHHHVSKWALTSYSGDYSQSPKAETTPVSISRQADALRSSYTMEYYSAIKRNDTRDPRAEPGKHC